MQHHLLVSLALFCAAAAAPAQMAPAPSHWQLVAVRSGIHANNSQIEGVVYRDFVTMPPGTPWLRLFFNRIWLGKDSYLRIVSLRDGSVQTMHMQHVEQWQHSSAYFNGDTVMVELVAGPGTAKNYFEIDKVLVGDVAALPAPETICGSTDDRVPSNHAAVGRIDPIGCSAWIIDMPWTGTDRLHLSAGHCSSTGVLEFDVPASSANCALQHPPPSKQFAIDAGSSTAVNGGVGNDYWVFRCFPNSTTGLTTYQTQGVAFQLSPSVPATSTTLRNYGFGVDGTDSNNATGNSCDCPGGSTGTRNCVQQTHTGPLTGSSGTSLEYAIDTCGGNSGSVVTEDASGQAVAIHTNGGCDAGGGHNTGTSVMHPYLLVVIAAMAGGGSAVVNDECTAAQAVVDGTNGPFSNAGATTSSAFPCSAASTGRDVWFRYVATSSGITMFDTCSATRNFDTVLELFAGPCGSLTSLGCSDDICGTGSSVAATLVAGNVYYARVGGYGGAQGAFDLTVTAANTADACSGAIPLQLGGNGPFSNTAATTSLPAWACGPGQRDVWFSYAAPPASRVTFTTCNAATSFDTVLEVFAGSCGGLTSLACNDDDPTCSSSSLRSRVTAFVQTATTLYLRVGGYGTATGTFAIDVTQLPANDDCTAAVPIVDGANGPYSNLGATTSPAWSCGMGGNDVWFVYTATRTGTVVVDTCSLARTFDTVLEAYTGGCGGLALLGCSDDDCGLGSSLSFHVVQGNSYRIRMGGYHGDQGQAILTVGCFPDNDVCQNAIPLALGVNGPFSSTAATTSAPPWQCGAGTGADVWFRYTATATAPLTFWTCTNTRAFDTVLEVFQGDCAMMAQLGCNDDACGLGSQVQINATAGANYLVRVGGFNGAAGAFDVEVLYGSGQGSIVRNAHGCGPTTLQVAGQPRIGSSLTFVIGNVTGLPVCGLGFVPAATPFCGCTIGHEWLAPMIGAVHVLNLPVNGGLIGLTFAVQGIDLLGVGGCPSPQLTLTDTLVVTIG